MRECRHYLSELTDNQAWETTRLHLVRRQRVLTYEKDFKEKLIAAFALFAGAGLTWALTTTESADSTEGRGLHLVSCIVDYQLIFGEDWDQDFSLNFCLLA